MTEKSLLNELVDTLDGRLTWTAADASPIVPPTKQADIATESPPSTAGVKRTFLLRQGLPRRSRSRVLHSFRIRIPDSFPALIRPNRGSQFCFSCGVRTLPTAGSFRGA